MMEIVIKTKTDSKNKWYVLYTKPRFEKRVKEKLEFGGHECYLPLHRSPRIWLDRVKIVDIPLFSSYIFVKSNESEIRSLLHIDGIVKIVFYDKKPAIIRQQEIDAIQMFIEAAEGKMLCTGDEVEILAGTMKSKRGKVIKIKKKYLMLHVEQLSAIVCVNTESVASIKRIR